MTQWFHDLFNGTFMPHGTCYLWSQPLIWLHVVSDSLIALAYYSIPVTLLYFLRKARDVAHPMIVVLFAAFIVACGTTHVVEVWSVWHADYWLSGGIKGLTAAISLTSAVALVRVVPVALALPSTRELKELNERLEERVRLRTADLTATNEQLRREIAQRQEADAEVLRLNRALELRVTELQTLFDALPVGVAIARDAACREITANRTFAAMLDMAPDANVSLSAPAGIAPTSFRIFANDRELRPDELPMQVAVRENRAVQNFEETIRRQDGSQVHVLVTALPLRDEQRQVTGAVATFQDITARKRAEAQRLEFERRMSETQKLESIGVLAGGIAHDFNNLLTAVIGNASLVRFQIPPQDATTLRQLHAIELAAERASDLCKQLLAYAGQGNFVIQALSLNDVIAGQTELLRLSMSKLVELKLDLAAQLHPIRADETQMHQIIMNLVSNASEAIGERAGTITLRTRDQHIGPEEIARLVSPHRLVPGWFVVLEVEDDGDGMSSETATRIFEPFFTTKFIGRGLGLAALIGIVRRLQGGIRVDSRVGHGTCFQLLFPALTDSGTPFPPDARSPGAGLRGRGTVLVVDDEEYVRDMVYDALTAAGYDAVVARDGEDAIQAVRSTPARFVAVLLDLSMPKLDGQGTLLALRLIAPNLPVVLTTGHSPQRVSEQFLQSGLAGFLPKPFTAERLIQAITDAIRRARKAVI